IFNHVSKNITTLELEVKHQYNLYLKEFIKVCISDGKLCQKEKKLIKQLMKRANITNFDVDYMIKKERQLQYQAAKIAALKSRKTDNHSS
ncbi:hypothetical protein N9N67_12530, partial [Bacteriovoracaceae bacterium]|nr:hypothetical protein [Bacteriovoracaceae bacterium]